MIFQPRYLFLVDQLGPHPVSLSSLPYSSSPFFSLFHTHSLTYPSTLYLASYYIFYGIVLELLLASWLRVQNT